MTGVQRVFLVTNSSEQVEQQQLRFLTLAREAGLGHIVYLSQLHASLESPLRFLRYHAAVEAAVRESGMSYTNLRPNLYMQSLLMLGHAIASEGRLYAPAGDARVSVVDVRDVAAVAVAALTQRQHEGKTYNITGPEAPDACGNGGTIVSGTRATGAVCRCARAEVSGVVVELSYACLAGGGFG